MQWLECVMMLWQQTHSINWFTNKTVFLCIINYGRYSACETCTSALTSDESCIGLGIAYWGKNNTYWMWKRTIPSSRPSKLTLPNRSFRIQIHLTKMEWMVFYNGLAITFSTYSFSYSCIVLWLVHNFTGLVTDDSFRRYHAWYDCEDWQR